MASPRIWSLFHILCIVSHFFMIVLSFVAFAADGFHNVSRSPTFDDDEERDRITTVAMPWAMFAVGAVSFFLSIFTYVLLRLLRSRYARRYNSAYHNEEALAAGKSSTRYTLATIVACSVFLIDIAIASWTATKIKDEKVLAAPVSAGIIAGLLSLGTGWVDYRIWREEKMVDEVHGGVVNEEPKPIVMVPRSLRHES